VTTSWSALAALPRGRADVCTEQDQARADAYDRLRRFALGEESPDELEALRDAARRYVAGGEFAEAFGVHTPPGRVTARRLAAMRARDRALRVALAAHVGRPAERIERRYLAAQSLAAVVARFARDCWPAWSTSAPKNLSAVDAALLAAFRASDGDVPSGARRLQAVCFPDPLGVAAADDAARS